MNRCEHAGSAAGRQDSDSDGSDPVPISVPTRVRLRPSRSSRWPKMMSPTRRITNATANVDSERSVPAKRADVGEEEFLDHRRRGGAIDREVVVLDDRTPKAGDGDPRGPPRSRCRTLAVDSVCLVTRGSTTRVPFSGDSPRCTYAAGAHCRAARQVVHQGHRVSGSHTCARW